MTNIVFPLGQYYNKIKFYTDRGSVTFEGTAYKLEVPPAPSNTNTDQNQGNTQDNENENQNQGNTQDNENENQNQDGQP